MGLEKETTGIKSMGRRGEVQSELNSNRELLERVLDRMMDLKEACLIYKPHVRIY